MTETGLSEEKRKWIDRVSDFLHRNRKYFIGIAVGVVAILVGILGYVEYQKKVLEESTRTVESVLKQLPQYQRATGEERTKLESSIVKELDRIISTYPASYAATRAQYIKGELYFEKKEYKTAAELWEDLAQKAPKSHLAPLSLLGAAVCKEELNDLDGAIQALKNLEAKFGKSFPDTPRVLFSLGRMHETKNLYNDAATYYNRLLDEYPASSWTKLARNRLIYFKTASLIKKS